jgi:tRNA nucleotidyltransferase/poly(A) polymerase
MRAELRLDRLTPSAVALLRAARASAPDGALVVVGGTVRDVLLGRPDADVDLAVERGALALAERIAARLDATGRRAGRRARRRARGGAGAAARRGRLPRAHAGR